ncbi:LysR family transcriptional regulator [Streptomyces solisilvae]|uniref:LysR family transcriptional regulator n=1 Tax=Streptomyces TaxID=1883 RepID=UPI00190D4B46|nr:MULTISPECIES: LysR family transcriptional regulator [Streptomyces]MCM3807439.1 LysR family transcriptional regulator [Streptomyces sp. DR7-3]UHH22872.1 LysR family transcriptional regulator [Streptomyces sp. HNM0561]
MLIITRVDAGEAPAGMTRRSALITLFLSIRFINTIDGANASKGRVKMSLDGVDLNLLPALDALLSERNVTRAAERMSVGQPAMSASLARLRKHFDDPLLVREGRTLTPTPLALSLTPLVREAVAAAEAVLGRARDFDPQVNRRSFTIMASDYVTLILLRPLVARLAQEAPLQRVNVIPVQADCAEQLHKGQVDLLVLPTEAAGGRFNYPHRHLFNDRYVLVADPDNDAVGPELSTEDFSQLPYVAYSGPLQSIADAQLDSLGISRAVEMTTHSFVIIPLLVAGTPLVSLVHERLTRCVAEQIRLRVVDPPMPLRPISEALFWSPRHTDDPSHSWLRERIAELAGEL